MDKIEENEQWKLSGDCSKCRRNNYCSKPCSKCNMRKRAAFRATLKTLMNQMTGGTMSEAIEKTVDNIYLK